VVWEEESKYPDLIIELLSQFTAMTDRTLKKELYQNRFRTPEYFWFLPENLEFAGFRLVGHEYEPIAANTEGQLWSEELGLHLGIEANQLRYFTAEGSKVPTPEEAAAQAELQLEQERKAKQGAQQRAEHLAERLRSLGINPD
jgi:hypothetical protein